MRPLAGVLGLAAFGAGAVALFVADNSAGSLFLLTLGTVLGLLAALGDRLQLESFEFLGAKIKVRELVRHRLELAGPAGGTQAGEQGDVLRSQALTLQKLARLHHLYGYVRANEPASRGRTKRLDALAARMKAAAGEAEFDPAEVAVWFHEGSDALRVIALNVMHARPECREFTAVLETIDAPRSLFEQFYGLGLGYAMLPELDEVERYLLARAIERARRRRRFRSDPPLTRLAERTLAELERRA